MTNFPSQYLAKLFKCVRRDGFIGQGMNELKSMGHPKGESREVKLTDGVILSGGKLDELQPAPSGAAGLIIQVNKFLLHVGAVGCGPIVVGAGGANSIGTDLVRVRSAGGGEVSWGLNPTSLNGVQYQFMRDMEEMTEAQAIKSFEKFVEVWFRFFSTIITH